MNVLFDTDSLIEFFRGNVDVINYIDSIGGEEKIILTAITFAEIVLFAQDKLHLNRLKKGIDELILLDINEGISEQFREYMISYSLSHRPSLPDMLNASFAKYYDIDFFTLNLSDYTFIKGLKLIKHNIKPLPRQKGFW